MSWRRFCKTSWRRLEEVLKTSWQHVLKMSWRCRENVLKTYDQDSTVSLDQDVLKTSSEDVSVRWIYSSWSRRLEDFFWRRRRKTSSRRLSDVFITTNVCWVKPLMPGGNKKVTHTETFLSMKTFLLPTGIKGLKFFQKKIHWEYQM